MPTKRSGDRSNCLFLDVIPVFRFAPSFRLSAILDIRHPLLSSTARRPSQRCDATTFLVLTRPPAGDARASVPARADCASRFPKTAFNSFHPFIPIPPLPLDTASGEFLRPAASAPLLFRFLPKLFANDSQDFLCPSRNADPRLGSSPLSLSSAPITGAATWSCYANDGALHE
jgi:hypothetical protein